MLSVKRTTASLRGIIDRSLAIAPSFVLFELLLSGGERAGVPFLRVSLQVTLFPPSLFATAGLCLVIKMGLFSARSGRGCRPSHSLAPSLVRLATRVSTFIFLVHFCLLDGTSRQDFLSSLSSSLFSLHFVSAASVPGASGVVNEQQPSTYPRSSNSPYPPQQHPTVYTPASAPVDIPADAVFTRGGSPPSAPAVYPPPPPGFVMDSNNALASSPPGVHTPPYPPSNHTPRGEAGQGSIAMMYPFSPPPSLSHDASATNIHPYPPPSSASSQQQQQQPVPLPPLPPSDPSFLMHLPPPPPPAPVASDLPPYSSSPQQPSPSPPNFPPSPPSYPVVASPGSPPPLPPGYASTPQQPHHPLPPQNLRHRHTPFPLNEEDVKNIKIGFEGAVVENEPMPKIEGHKRIMLGAAGSFLGLSLLMGMTAGVGGIPLLAGIATGLTTTGLGIGGLAWGSYKKVKSQQKRDEWMKKKLRERVSLKADPVLYDIQEKAKNIVRESLLQSASPASPQDSSSPSHPPYHP